MNIISKVACCTFVVLFSVTALGNDSEQGDVYFSGYSPDTPSQLLKNTFLVKQNSDYTVLDAAQYQQTVKDAREKIQYLLSNLQENSYPDNNARLAFIVQELLDIPYIFTGAMGEGDWQPTSSIYEPLAIHVKQDPVYRLDGLDCQTFVQMAMALLYSKDLNDFDRKLLKISYGAAGNPSREIVHYYNRNNFVDGDWNPINERNGWLIDVTSQGELSDDALTTFANVTRKNWFLFQQKNLPATVRVLRDIDGPLMARRFMTVYSKLNYPNFETENVPTTYLPKEKLVIQQPDGSYQPNQPLLDKIPTPAVVEIVRNVKKWTIGGKNIKDIIGSELSISHLGLLYRKTFQQGDIIYYKIICHYDDQHQKICEVRPIICEENQCSELMFAHATDAYPNGYYWYKKPDGNYTCSPKLPFNDVKVKATQCNRVEQQPLFDYLTDYQYGSYWYMNSPSIIGIHIEKLS